MKTFFFQKISIVFFSVFLILGFQAHAQASFEPLNREYLFPKEQLLSNEAGNFHSNCKPYLTSELKFTNDSFFVPTNRFLKRVYLAFTPSSETTKSEITVAPLVTLLPGYDLATSSTTFDSRLGGKVNFNFRDKFSAELQLLNINADFPEYWNTYSKQKKIIPGNGYAYRSNLGYTTLQWTGYLSFSPNSHFNFAAGRGKNFFGDGYRSLLLSDVANNYEYFKITSTIWKLKYINLFTNLKTENNPIGKSPKQFNKYASTHYLSWNATKRINISFFESIVWQSRDSNNANLGYDVNYLNPVIFYRPTEYALGSGDNALIGASFKVKLMKQLQVYGQLIIDEFLLKEMKAQSGWWANKQGVQLGIKTYSLFKLPNLFFQLEWNSVRPYTYAHSNTAQNYGHNGEALAHPLGANFNEYFVAINYRFKAWMLDVKCSFAELGLDTSASNFGQDIYKSNIYRVNDYGNKTGQGLKTELISAKASLCYLINRANNVQLELSYMQRFQSNGGTSQSTNFVCIGVRTALANLYNDF